MNIAKNTWGTLLILFGVLAWVPYFYYIGAGRDISIFPFLAAHLAGVLSGAWMRANANQDTGTSQSVSGRRRRIASRVMIYLGVLAWAPYFYLSRVKGLEIDIFPFSIVHLTGVLGGVAVRASIGLDKFIRPS